MNHSSSSASRLGILALLALSTAAFIACSGSASTTSSTTSTSSTSSGEGGGTTGTGGSGGTSASTSASTGTGSSLAPAAQVAKLCGDIVTPYCEAILACCTNPTTIANVGGTVEGCKTKLAADCFKSLGEKILPQVEAGNTVLDEARLAVCVSDLESMKAGGAACTRPPTFVLQLDCVSAFQGTLAPGAACDVSKLSDNEYIPCKEGVCDSGKCVAFLPSGAACNPSAGNFIPDGCNYVNGERCNGAGVMGTCGPQGAIGALCWDAGKDNSFTCKSLSCGPAGTCITPTANGLCSSG